MTGVDATYLKSDCMSRSVWVTSGACAVPRARGGERSAFGAQHHRAGDRAGQGPEDPEQGRIAQDRVQGGRQGRLHAFAQAEGQDQGRGAHRSSLLNMIKPWCRTG